MDQWGMTRATHQTQPQQVQQQVQQQQGVASQYSYSSSSYSGQQAAAPSSAASAAYGQPQAYSQQAYAQQAYVQQQPMTASAQPGYVSTATYGAPSAGVQPSAQQQQLAWSQQASVQGAQQADQSQGAYGRSSTGVASVPSSGGGSANAAAQYGGQYGVVYSAPTQGASQQLLGASGRGVTSTDDYQTQTVATRGSTAYGAPQDSRATIASGASYVVGGAPSVSASGVYGASDATKYAEVSKYGEAPKYGEAAKYGEMPKYVDTAKYGGTASTAGYGGKASDYSGATSPTAYSQKTAADQYGASYNLKSTDYGISDRGHFGQTQGAYGQADSQADTARRYQDAHAAAAVGQQRQQQHDRQDQQSQLLRQQQAIQAQQLQVSLVNRGAATSPLEGATRGQGDYIGRGAAVRTGGTQDYGGSPRGMIGGNYAPNRAEAELVAQYGGGGGGRSGGNAGSGTGYLGSQQTSMYGGITGGRGLGGQLYGGHNAPTMGYGGVQLPPGRDYSAGRGTGGGGFSGQRDSYGGGGGSRSDRPSIGSSRNDDRRDQRPPFRSGGGERRHDDASRRRDSNRDRGRSSNRVGVGSGRGAPGGGGSGGLTGPFEREDRDRGRDRDRDRRDDDRKRDRSPGLRASHDRKMSPAGDRDERGRKESPRRESSHRHSSPSKEKRRDYICKIEPYSLVEAERDYPSICKRYSKLYVVPEFSKLVACWMDKDVELPLNQPISFEHDAVDIEDESESTKEAPPNISDKALPSSASAITPSTPTSSKPALQTTVWNAKVMLMSGLGPEAYAEFLSDKSTEDKPAHLHNLLKFVALRKDRSAIMAAGGPWDKELDGGDPASDDSGLIKAAIRCTRDSTQLDLSGCKSWSRLVEVHYERLGEDGLPSHKEITVMFLPTLGACIPFPEIWQTQWKQRQQARLDSEAAAKQAKEAPEKKEVTKAGDSNGLKEEKEGVVTEGNDTITENEGKLENKEKPEEKKDEVEDVPSKVTQEGSKERVAAEGDIPLPGLVLTTKRTKLSKMRSMTISLDGLLDYDEEDREECTFELSLFAEVFQEMLQYKMGSRILSNLEILREESYSRRREERKRKSDNEKEMDAEGSSSQRKRTKFSDKPEVVEVKLEGEVKPELEMKTHGEPVKREETTEENGLEGEKMEENCIKKESEVGGSQAATAATVTETETQKLEMNGTEELKEEVKDAEMTEATQPVIEEEKVEERRVEKKVVVDQELLQAYRFFDKNRVGYLKSEDLRRLLHCLGNFLSHRNVKDLVGCAVMESKSARDERIAYRSFTEKEVEVDMAAAE